MTEFAFRSASDLAASIKARDISCVELLNLYLDRVDRINADLNAIIVQIRDAAMARAEEADRAARERAKTGARCTACR